MSAPRRLQIAFASAAVLLAAGLAACGSTSSSSTAATAPPPTQSPSTAGPSSAAPTTAEAAGTPLLASGPVPAVTGATDLTKEPSIAAGTPPAPTTPTGKDLVVGTGTVAGPDDTVKVQYVGALFTTGQVFDASWTDSGPTSFPLGGVIAGFKDAIVGMAVGGRREVVIPAAEGYGASGQGAIPPNATLVFVIDLLGVTPGT